MTTYLGADWLRRLILAPEKSLISATVVIENAASATDAKVKKLPWRQVIFHRCKEGTGHIYQPPHDTRAHRTTRTHSATCA